MSGSALVRRSRVAPIVLFAFLISAFFTSTALADFYPPDPEGVCHNSAYNAFELDRGGDIDQDALYFDDDEQPTFSNPPSSYVVTLTGPGEAGDPPTWTYNYRLNTNEWLIWRIVSPPEEELDSVSTGGSSSDGSVSPSSHEDLPEGTVEDNPPQRGTLTFSEEEGARPQPDYIIFCLVEAGSLVVKKDVNPNNEKDFRYNISSAAPFSVQPVGPYGGFTLDDDPNSKTFSNSAHLVLPIRNMPDGGDVGPYTVREDPQPGWELQSINCSGEADDGSVQNLGDREVIVDLDAGESITCTFVNADETLRIPSTQGLAATGVPVDVRTYGLGLLSLAVALVGGLLIKRPRTQ